MDNNKKVLMDYMDIHIDIPYFFGYVVNLINFMVFCPNEVKKLNNLE